MDAGWKVFLDKGQIWSNQGLPNLGQPRAFCQQKCTGYTYLASKSSVSSNSVNGLKKPLKYMTEPLFQDSTNFLASFGGIPSPKPQMVGGL